MDLDELVKSKSEYLKKEDVNGETGVTLTITGFKRVKVDGNNGEEDKVALFFAEPVKPLLLNITNKNRLKIATGATTTDGCKGKKICVYNDPYVEFGGKVTGGIRIRAVTGQVANAPEELDGPDDDVPF